MYAFARSRAANARKLKETDTTPSFAATGAASEARLEKSAMGAKYADCNRRRTLLIKAIAVMLAVAYAAVPVPAVATGSRQQAAQMQLDPSRSALNAEAFVSQLGELRFTSGSARLSPGAMGELNELSDFLGRNPDSSVVIRGYTDSVGNEEYNQGLSDRRANSAKAYLVARGIGSTRLSASGMGQSTPVSANDSAAGRQQNRRVEVVISNPPAASAHQTRREQMLVLLMLLGSTSGSLGKIFR